ncbi:hypothetical protein RDWZM_006929 [Blomia tropicalis]|uniref:Diuretic hormone class 2 n=1 Tax=Blomia tropicalis TaxID=40697 RepID=A0A9Q0MBF5_BLOTA|nr:Diuretic hormone [Blomia tropicalis]KAJ6221117.1 hypothetical protein RDWZM_006929 [Blomia tropicalis]
MSVSVPNSMMQARLGLGLSTTTILATIVIVLLSSSICTTKTDAYPLNVGLNNEIVRKHPITLEIDNPEEVLSVLDNLMQNIVMGIEILSHSGPMVNEKSMGSKRGIDLGLSRGFSGSQAAKHLMGMSAASFANGPGRRRK